MKKISVKLMAKSLDRVANHHQNNPYRRMETGGQGKDCV